MAECLSTLDAGAVFSDAALARLACDEPITAHDSETSVDLSYRFEHHAGGVLRLSGGRLGDRILVLGCDETDVNLAAGLLLAGLKVCRP